MREETQICRARFACARAASFLAIVASLAASVLPAAAHDRDKEEIVVFAAASLIDAFRQIAEEFLGANPGTVVRFNFAGSQQLAMQLTQGARADVFASADQQHMSAAAPQIDTASVRIFARNRLVVAVPGVKERRVRGLSDLGAPGTKIVLADRSVPAGRYALAFLDRCSASGEFPGGFREKVLGNVVSYEENVRAVLGKVTLDEADAGIVYISDVVGAARHGVDTIRIPEKLNITAEYPIGRTKDSRHSALAAKLIAFILSDRGQDVLVHWGFSGIVRP